MSHFSMIDETQPVKKGNTLPYHPHQKYPAVSKNGLLLDLGLPANASLLGTYEHPVRVFDFI